MNVAVAGEPGSLSPWVGNNFGRISTLGSVYQKAYEDSGDDMAMKAVGTTPYQFVEYIPGTSLTLERSGKYWQDAAETMALYGSNVDVINFKFVTDISQIATGLKTGELDMTNTIAAMDLPAFSEGGEYADRYTVVEEKANPAYMMMFNCSETSPCSNVNLRKAIAYGINSDQLLSGVLGGAGFRLNAFGNSKYGDYNPDWNAHG